MQRLATRQAIQEAEESVDLFVDRRVLPVRGDHVLGLSPQRIHRVQLRRPLRQPKQRHPLGRPQRCPRRMTRVRVEQQRDVPPPVVPADLTEERLEVTGTPLGPRQHQPCPGHEVHRPEDHPPGVPAADVDLGRLAPERPAGPQRREHH